MEKKMLVRRGRREVIKEVNCEIKTPKGKSWTVEMGNRERNPKRGGKDDFH